MSESFAIFKESGVNQLYCYRGNCEKFPSKIEFAQMPNGFILSPWAKSDQIWCISGEKLLTNQHQVLLFLRDLKGAICASNIISTTYSEFEKEVISIQQEINKGNFEKAVASRVEAILSDFDIVKIAQWFVELTLNHPMSFVWLSYTPEFGLWIGATPETLISFDGNKVHTMSLAGTLLNENEQWSGKERLEQSVTSKFILETLNSFCIGEVEPTEVVESKSGNLRHLQSGFKAQIEPANIGMLIEAFSPTPAVGGYPQEESIKWLLENETYDRELFTGFIGPKMNDNLNLFVNLRCAKITMNQHLYYAGCGINRGSEIQKEWNETAAKMEVIRNYWN